MSPDTAATRLKREEIIHLVAQHLVTRGFENSGIRALAESVGSAASYVFLDAKEFFVRGIEIAANHVKSIKEGFVYAKASIIHKGRTTQLWEIKITDEDGNLVSNCKLTTIALPRK